MRTENKITHYAKVALAIGILACLWVPMIRQYRATQRGWDLMGDIVEAPKPILSWNSWNDESFQKSSETWLNQNFGFRNLLVRLHNQIHYSVFKTAKANGVTIGKNNYLYEEAYIKAAMGTDYLGDTEIEKIAEKVKKIQDTLMQKNILFFVLLAPGKASFFPEYIPDRYIQTQQPNTNYAAFVREFGKQKIIHLDFHSWFRTMKGHTKYPLYGQGGIHWSHYGEYLAADSLIAFIGKTQNRVMPNMVLDNIEVSEKNLLADNDIGNGMNLLFENPTYPMAYPHFHFEKDTNVTPATVLVVADSYYWGMFNAGISRDAFNNGRFWFYNQAIYPDSYTKPLNVGDIDVREQVEKNNIIILLQTDATLPRFGFGLIDQLFHAYFPYEKTHKR